VYSKDTYNIIYMYILNSSFLYLQELELCHCLLSVATHHHNKLHIVNLIPPISELHIDLRSTLAYLTICQLGASQRNQKLTSTDWSFISLVDEYFNLRIDESADMYLLHSLISLFEIAVGNEIEPEERVIPCNL